MESKLSKDAIVRELRQPLTSVLAAVHLAEGCDEDDAPNAKLAQLRSYGRQLATALADIDGLEQLLQGNVAVEALTYDLPELLDCFLDTHAARLGRDRPPLDPEVLPALQAQRLRIADALRR